MKYSNWKIWSYILARGACYPWVTCSGRCRISWRSQSRFQTSLDRGHQSAWTAVWIHGNRSYVQFCNNPHNTGCVYRGMSVSVREMRQDLVQARENVYDDISASPFCVYLLIIIMSPPLISTFIHSFFTILTTIFRRKAEWHSLFVILPFKWLHLKVKLCSFWKTHHILHTNKKLKLLAIKR